MWFWNGRLDRDLLIAQMDEMVEKGVKAFFIHPMPQEFRPKDFVAGLEVEYLGGEYLNAVRRVVEAAATRGMKVWLYDEGGWPSGSNLGRVAEERPDLRGKVAHYNEEGQVEVLERGYPVDLLDPETTRTFIKQVHERYASVVGEFFGTTIPGIFTDEPRYGGRVGGAEIPWTPKLPEIFKEKKGYDLKLGLAILFGLKASRSLPEGKRDQVLCDFYHFITQLWRDSYFRVLQEWCHAHNLALVGHINNEETLLGHLTNGGDFFKAMECMDWPGLDVIQRQVFPGELVTDFPKFASSTAHVRGKARVLSESFAVYGWDLTYEQMKYISDFQFVRGVNALSPMAFYGDTRGARKIGTMSEQFLANPLWEHYREYADYVGRLSALLTLGKPVVEVGVYYPIKSLWVGDDANRVEPSFNTLSRSLLEKQIDFDYLDDDAICRATISDDGALCVGDCRYRAVLFSVVSIVPIETLRQLRLFAQAGGTVVFLHGEPHLTCRAASQTELPEILAAMNSFSVSDGSDSDVVLGTLPWTIKLGIVNHAIRAMRRTTGETDIFFITNESHAQEQALRIRLPVEGPTYVFDLETGALTGANAAAGMVRHTLPPLGSVALLVGKGDVPISAAPPTSPPSRIQPFQGPWSLTVTKQWVYRDGEIHLLDAADLHGTSEISEVLKPWGDRTLGSSQDEGEGASFPQSIVGSTLRVDELAHWNTTYSPTFCGSVEYLVACDIGKEAGRVELDLGLVGVVAEVIVNEQPLGKRLWPPYRFDVTDAMVSGLNTMRIIVTSTLHRLMSAPEVVADLKERGWFNAYAHSVSEFKGAPAPAGLIGPVILRMWK